MADKHPTTILADLKNLIAAFAHWDRIGRDADKAGDIEKENAAVDRQTEILENISAHPVATPADIIIKLAFAADAYGVTSADRDISDEAIGGFCRQSLLDAQRIVAAGSL